MLPDPSLHPIKQDYILRLFLLRRTRAAIFNPHTLPSHDPSVSLRSWFDNDGMKALITGIFITGQRFLRQWRALNRWHKCSIPNIFFCFNSFYMGEWSANTGVNRPGANRLWGENHPWVNWRWGETSNTSSYDNTANAVFALRSIPRNWLIRVCVLLVGDSFRNCFVLAEKAYSFLQWILFRDLFEIGYWYLLFWCQIGYQFLHVCSDK